MTHSFLSGMARATALTRAGKLMEATAELQRNLSGAPEAPASDLPKDDDQDVVEGVFSVVDEAAPSDTEPKAGKSRTKSRKPLGETLRDIARGGMPEKGQPTGRNPANDSQFTLHHHSGPEGSRDYMLFVPSPMPTAPCPVVVMLHGCTQSPQDFADGTGMNDLAQAQGVIVVYPAQPTGANMNKCWNWFRPADQGRGAGEPAILASITREVLASQNADPARVYVAGLSAGGAAAVLLAQAYPDVFAAVGVHSGLAAGAATDVGSAFAAMRNGAKGAAALHPIPTIVFHGTADATVDIANAHAVMAQAQNGVAGTRKTTKGKVPKGRSYTRTALTNGERSMGEVWLIDGAGHAWSGGTTAGSYTDPTGPDASAEMLRFFAQHHRV